VNQSESEDVLMDNLKEYLPRKFSDTLKHIIDKNSSESSISVCSNLKRESTDRIIKR
jgi:hypothetical protein